MTLFLYSFLIVRAKNFRADRGLQLLQRDQRGMEQKSTVGEQAATESTAATNRSGSNAPKSDSDEEVGFFSRNPHRVLRGCHTSIRSLQYGGSRMHTTEG